MLIFTVIQLDLNGMEADSSNQCFVEKCIDTSLKKKLFVCLLFHDCCFGMDC